MHFQRTARGTTGKTGSLPPTLTVEQLTEVFGEPRDVWIDSDMKVEYEWAFTFDDGSHGAIWDYRGVLWSVGGGRGVRQMIIEEIELGLGITLPEIGE